MGSSKIHQHQQKLHNCLCRIVTCVPPFRPVSHTSSRNYIGYPLIPVSKLLCEKKIEDEKHFIFSCPQYEEQRESFRAIGKAENITEDTVLLHFFMNSEPSVLRNLYLVKFASSALQDVEF